MNVISTPKAPQAIGPYSQAIAFENMIFTSGQIALLEDGRFLEGTIEEQTKQVLQNLIAVLEAAGSSLSKVIKTTIFLTNMDDFQAVNGVYGTFFSEHKPARSTVAVKALPRNALVEIEVIASK